VTEASQEERRPAAAIATAIGDALFQATDTGRAEDAPEVRAITEAMVRLLVGIPLRSDGQLTIKSLAEEADLRRNKLTHKHTGLKDLFYALVRSQDNRPKIADGLHADNDRLRQKLADLRAEHTKLQQHMARFARVIHVLEVENAQLREHSQPGDVVRPLPRRPTDLRAFPNWSQQARHCHSRFRSEETELDRQHAQT
jgi:hypothetical protein